MIKLDVYRQIVKEQHPRTKLTEIQITRLAEEMIRDEDQAMADYCKRNDC